MNRTPKILSIHNSDNECALFLFLAADLDFFKGHFPGVPVLPGVVQLHWAVELAQQHFGYTKYRYVQQVEVLKFQQLLIPEQQVELVLTRKSAHKFAFSYRSNFGLHASGRVIFKELT